LRLILNEIMTRHTRTITAAAVALLAAACAGDTNEQEAATGGAQADAGVVNVYSHRHYDTDDQLFQRFTERTGIKVNVVTAGADELIARLESEGASTQADVLITVDAGRLHRAKERGLLQPIASETLEQNIPEHLRDRDNMWFGLTRRARIIAYAKDRVQPSQLSTYEALAQPEWKGRVTVRSSDNVYNQSLLASIIAHNGADAAREWAQGIANNLSRQPSGGDTDQIKAIAAGTGDVAIVNSYYLARLQASDDAENRRIGEMIAPFFPNQGDRGTHVNVSGAGVTAHAKNRDNAVRLIEFLSSPEAQELFAQGNQEYPVNPAVQPSPTLAAWGEFRADTLNLSTLGELNAEAVRIFDAAGWR
jgi:iron(III) transport system substrate-binding protein